ncbi:transmembrane channel-like protein 5 [Aplysia californica]|uniref:Transmembrane channel-like protein 5 n=1 Tax=Aplysia californica TaxID=6500 RepID=A0ABM0K4S0_APLCA|nr:transmembrane channel-like protein 5 [Aplysia californica]XP_005108731.1 transmembrane channel-like protein 5 [Aplysia californica]
MSIYTQRIDPVNPHYDDGNNYDSIQLQQVPRHTQPNGQHVGNVRLSTRTTMDGSQPANLEEQELDRAMEELIDQLPSRQLADNGVDFPSRTLRARKSFRGRMGQDDDSLDDDFVENFHQELEEENADLDDIDAAVRTMPTTLSRKRKIMHRLSSRRQKKLSQWKLLKYWIQMAFQRLKHRVRKVSRLFDLWRSHLMTIEGCFGTSVLSYFIFLKWVLLINIPLFLLTFCFLVIPQILYRYYQKVPPGYEGHTEEFTGIELLTGAGFFEDTEMYYGFYTNETVGVVGSSQYQMNYAYLFTCGGYYLFCLIILGYSYLHSYRKYYIEASGTVSLYYFSMVLCGWDYGIVSPEASQLKHKSIFNEFKEYLAGRKSATAPPTRDDVARKWAFRCFAWLVVLALLGASGYVTYTVSVELSIKPKLANTTSIPVVSPLAMPVVISTIQLFVPMIFTLLEGQEQFSKPKYELYVHMFRDMALKATMLAVLVYFWFDIAATELKCWETFVGQEIYRLVMVDLLFTLGYSFFIEFVRKLLSLKWEIIERAEFAIGRHTLELVYSQSLCWLGVFYSPLLPVVVIIKLIIIFYVKRVSVVQNCKPSLKPWRASRTHTIFVGYLFGFFILTSVAVGCGIFLIKPSIECGPYKHRETSYDVIKEMIDNWKADHDVWREVFGFINSPGFVVGLLVLLGMIWYYTRTIMLSHKEMVAQFKKQLQSEGKDKKFLMNLLNQVKVRGRRVSHHRGPTLHKTMETMSSSPSTRGGNKVFVKTVAESVVSASPGQ